MERRRGRGEYGERQDRKREGKKKKREIRENGGYMILDI